MKLVKYIIVFSLLCVSCKQKKYITGVSGLERMTIKTLAKRHHEVNFDKKTADVKFHVNYIGERAEIDFGVRMKMIKDEVIYLKGTKLITVFKAKITPTRVSGYSPYFRKYFDVAFSELRKVLGVDLNFKQLQNMFLGQAMLGLEKQRIKKSEEGVLLTPEVQSPKFTISYLLNSDNFKLKKQFLSNSDSDLSVAYPAYINQDKTFFPKQINIIAKKSKEKIQVLMAVKSLVFNKELNTAFNIPSGYKKIKL